MKTPALPGLVATCRAFLLLASALALLARTTTTKSTSCPVGFILQSRFFSTGSPAAATTLHAADRAAVSSTAYLACEETTAGASGGRIAFVPVADHGQGTGVDPGRGHGGGTDSARAGGSRTVVLNKRLEATYVADTDAYLNLTKKAVLQSDADLLGNRLLAFPRGFTLDDVASAVPPMRSTGQKSARNFVGSRGAMVDISLDINLTDLNALGLPTLEYAVGMFGGSWDTGGMREGKIGGALPTLCYMFPDITKGNAGGWWEVDYIADANATEHQAVYVRYTRTDGRGRLVAWPVNHHIVTSLPLFQRSPKIARFCMCFPWAQAPRCKTSLEPRKNNLLL